MIRQHMESEEAWDILEATLPFCVDIMLDYMDAVNGPGVTAIRGPMSKRSFCSTLADYFYSRMEQSQQHGSLFERRSDRGQHYISFGDRLNIRIKQLDRRHLSWNLNTPHAVLWNRQATLPGMDRAPRLELGYRLDPLMNGYDSIHVLLRNEDEVEWRVQIYGARTDVYDIQQPSLNGMGPGRTVYQYRPVPLSKGRL